MKKLILSLLLPTLFFVSCKKDGHVSDALSAIPVQSAFVVRVNDLADFAEDVSQSLPAQALQQSLVFTKLNEFSQLLSGLTGGSATEIKAFGSYHVSGAGTYGWLWSIEAGRLPGLSKSALEEKGTLQSREFSGSEIAHFNNENLDFYFALKNGLILFSRHENLVEDGLKQLESNINLSQSAPFMHVLKTVNSKDPINVFVQFNALSPWLETTLQNEPIWLGNLATWSALDLDVNESDINLTGITLVPDSAKSYAGLFSTAGNGSAKFEEIIPINSALVVNQTCGDFTEWAMRFEEFLGVHNRLKKRDNKLSEFGIEPKSWYDLIDEEIGVFYAEGSASTSNSKAAYFRINNPQMAATLWEKQSAQTPEYYRDFAIYKMSKRNVLPLLYGQLFSYFAEPYWFHYKNWIICANDIGSAKNIINNLIAEKTWINDAGYNSIDALKDDDAHLLVIAKNPAWLELINKEVKPEEAKALEAEKDKLSQINWVLVQFKQRNEAAYTELVFQNQVKQVGSAKQFWTVALDQPMVGKPQLVLNHYSKINEVLVQDAANNLYLIDGNGKILWKRSLNGKILGEVAQVDLYKNNKLQLAFATPKSFYILDRNGKDVGAFPVSLPGQATAPLGVFDYAKNRDYRFVIPIGNRLYNYNKDAKQVSGWTILKAKSDIITQPKHRVLANKDFIYLADVTGNVYVLNRRGEVRVPLTKKMKHLQSDLRMVGNTMATSKLIALGPGGHQLSLYLNDNIDSIQPFGEEPNFFTMVNDAQAFAGGDQLYFRSEKSNFDAEVDGVIDEEPAVFATGGSFYIALSSGENITVFDGLGNQLPGMPIYGQGKCTMGRTLGKEIHVFVASPDGVLQDYKLVQPE